VPELLRLLLDQNIPRSVRNWLTDRTPSWTIHHTSDVGLEGATDASIFEWAQEREAVVVTFDEDLADQRSFPVGDHAGVIRLRVWPTTAEETRRALQRLFDEVPASEIQGALVIVDRTKIRIRT
jgi:predicted nuclease of predicted toxin-antitoxin system